MDGVPVRRPLADRLLVDVGPAPTPPGWTVRTASDRPGLEFSRRVRGLWCRRWIVSRHRVRRITEPLIGPTFDQTYDDVSHMIIVHGLWEPVQHFRSLPPGPIAGSTDSLAFVDHGHRRIRVHRGSRAAASAARAERARSRVRARGASLDESAVRRELGDMSANGAARTARALGWIVRETYRAGHDAADQLILDDPRYADDVMDIEQPTGLSAPIAATVLGLGRLMAKACDVPLYVMEEWTPEPSSGD